MASLTARTFLMAQALLATTSCAGSPVAPSAGESLPFRQGVYALSLHAPDAISIGGGPLVAACPGASVLGDRAVYSRVVMTLEQGVWRGRPDSSAEGSFDLQFASGPVGPAPSSDDHGVVGTASGLVISTSRPFPTSPVPDLRVVLGSGTPATFNGGIDRSGFVSGGLVSGNIVFSNSSGQMVSCNSGTVNWFMSWLGG